MTESPWRPEDKEWLAQRKAEWRYVKRNLDLLSPRVKKKHQGAHKELFFYGRVDPALGKTGGEPFFYMLLFFEVWYHPNPTPEVLQNIYDKQQSRHPLNDARDNLFLFYHNYWGDFPPEYGLMGGREELLVRMLFPSHDHTQVREFRYEWPGGSQMEVFPLCWEPYRIFGACYSDTKLLLTYGKTSPYLPGQYLWEHLAAVIAEDTFKYEGTREGFLELLRYVATYETQPEFPWHNPGAVALAKRLKERFEARDFPERMLRYWDEAVAGLDSTEGGA